LSVALPGTRQARTKAALTACSVAKARVCAAQVTSLQDGGGRRPAYNLRTLCRALEYARAALPTYGLQRALYDGAAMAFLTQLAPASAPGLERLLRAHLLGGARSLKAHALSGCRQHPVLPLSHSLSHGWSAAGPRCCQPALHTRAGRRARSRAGRSAPRRPGSRQAQQLSRRRLWQGHAGPVCMADGAMRQRSARTAIRSGCPINGQAAVARQRLCAQARAGRAPLHPLALEL